MNENVKENALMKKVLEPFKNPERLLLCLSYALSGLAAAALCKFSTIALIVSAVFCIAYGVYALIVEQKIVKNNKQDSEHRQAVLYNTAVGFICVGVVSIVGALLYPRYILFFVGAVLFIKGAVNLTSALLYLGSPYYPKNIFNIIGASVTIVTGGLVFAYYWINRFWIYIIVGILLIAVGILSAYEIRNKTYQNLKS